MTTIVHPAEFYVAAKPLGEHYFWKVGSAQSIALMAIRPNGEKVAGVTIRETVAINRERLQQIYGLTPAEARFERATEPAPLKDRALELLIQGGKQ